MEEPSPGRPGALPDGTAGPDPDPDPDWAEYVAWRDGEIAAGRDPDEADALAFGGGPEDPAEQWWGPVTWGPAGLSFTQDGQADVLSPGPLLAQLTEQAILSLGRLSDDELAGVVRATCRQVAREQYKQVLATAEYANRRRAAFEDAGRRGVPSGCRPGGFPGEELAIELVTTPTDAGHRIDDAIDLTTRLPQTLAAMATGRVDADRAGWIAFYTRSLSPGDAARADAILAAAASDLRVDQVARRAQTLESKLNPEAVKARKERARWCEQRVEARREASGNASLSGREMATADAIASKAFIDAIAARLRRGGLPGSLGTLRVLAMADLTQGRDPMDRLSAVTGSGPQPSDAAQTDADHHPQDEESLDEGPEGEDSPPSGPAGDGTAQPAPVPLPALVNLIIPVGTLLGWSTAPAQAGAWGLLDRDETRAIAQAAARHPRTRWCATLVAPDGTAVAHGCARGQYPSLLDKLEPQPPPGNPKAQAPPGNPALLPSPPQQLSELMRRLGLAFSPIARGPCDHAQAEEQYTPSRRLRHLVRARSATCDAPGCQAQAINADLDHTRAWPAGPTEQCNLAARCRTHHRAKQAPDWKVKQLAPGVTRWTLPSGRIHITTPTKYDT